LSKSRSGAPKRVAAGLLAGALCVFGIALAPTAGAVDDVSGDRIAGINRYATAAAVAGQTDFDGATTAILATGETFPDALAASGLAGANGPAPIILTESETYSDEAQEALTNLTSITDVIIVGGTAAVSQDVQDAVEADGFTVTRVAGTDRYETAAEIAGEIGTAGDIDGLASALIATGTGFADALAGGPVSYAGGLPILLVEPTSIPAATSAAIADLGIEQAIILGGTAAVSDEVAAELDAATGNPSVRVADVNRFGTAAAVGEFAIAELGWAPTEVLLASGLNFPDALSGGPLGGERMAPVILTASLPEESEAFLDAHSNTIEDITALGGTGVIDAETLAAAETAAEETDNDDDTPTNETATTRPELVSATIVETRTAAAATATRPAGTYVMYCFDEAITGAVIDATDFHLYNGDGTRFSGTPTEAPAGAQTFTSGVSATDNTCAEVIFGGPVTGGGLLDTATEAAGLTLATVDDSAVTGAAGAATDTNIEGDAPLTPAGSTSAAAGVTAAPDLVSVGNFRAGSTADVTAVDFTFDSAATIATVGSGSGFGLQGINGTPYACQGPLSTDTTTASGLAAPGGNGTTVITVNCVEPGGPSPLPSTQHTAESVARGWVRAGTVGTTAAGANANPLEAADVANGGNSDGPDLVLAVFAPDAVAGFDVVGYIFDEEVLAGTGTSATYLTSASFGIYSTTGAEVSATFTPAFALGSCSRSSESNATVTCLFADNTLSGATYVGANVDAGAVTEVSAGALTNGNDEVGVAPSSGPTAATGGTTDGPDLTSVAINTVVSPFGNTSYTVTYTFDEDTSDDGDDTTPGALTAADDVVLNLMHLYTADGIRLDCDAVSGALTADAALAARTEDTDNAVVCSAFVVNGTAVAATQAQVRSAVVGTVEFGAVDDETVGGDVSPEGAELTSGGNGTPV
jgi:putative cell wall-binding protein